MSNQPSDNNEFKLLIKRARKNTVKQKSEAQQYNIYQKGSQQSIPGSLNSSFKLQEKPSSRNEQQNIQKVLHRLGLNKKQGAHKDEELEMVVGNIVENCLGTVNTEINALEYDKIYGAQYKQLVAAKGSQVSIHVNQLNDLQKIQLLSSNGIFGVYKYIRYIAKKISILCQSIVEHNLFESCILVIIILNSVKMSFDDPLSSDDPYATIEDIFTGLYTTEMVLKICAFGFIIPSKAYLRDPWNILDFVIVITSLMPLVIDLNFSVNSLRAIRVLRPLKTITKVKALKMIVSTLFHSFSLVMDSLYILTFVMFVFAIAGTQLFSGILKQRCVEIETGSFDEDSLCSIGGCSQGFICAKTIASPNFSINNFDTIMWSLLSVFRTLTLEGWSDIMLDLQKCFNDFAFIYSVLIVFFCEYVLLNMTLAILKYKYSQVKGNTIEEEQQEKTDYEPQFLKKLGIFGQITRIPTSENLVRQPIEDKIFVGSQIYFQVKSNAIENPFNYQFSKLRKLTEKIAFDSQNANKTKKQKIDIDQLKNIGKIDQHRWDAKCLFFQSDLPINGADEDAKVKVRSNSISIKSNKSIKDNNQQIPQQNDSDQQSSDDEYSDQQSDSIQSDKQEEVNGHIFEITQKLNKSKKNIESNLLEIPKQVKISISDDVKEDERKSSNKLKSKKRVSSRRNVSKQNRMKQELDSILGIISRDAMQKEAKQTTFQLNLPQIDFDQSQVDKLYERFKDLGQYKIKRQQKINELHFFKINHKKQAIEKKVVPNIMKQIQEQNSLDIKQLQMVNQLSKKIMKCRIKPKNLLDQQTKYDESRVLVSQKLKENEKKQKQLFDSLENMNFDVKYKFQQVKVDQQLEKSKKGLKIPEPIGYNQRKEDYLEQDKNQDEEENGYLKLLQNHQMEQKIEMEETRLMQVFFKKEKVKPQKLEEQPSLQMQYRLIREADIYNRHGNIVLPCPFEQQTDQELVNSINIHPEQYEIYVKGFFGVINVMRKKTLLFIKTPFYDNFMLLFVIGNTLTLSLNGFFNTDSQAFLTINYIFTAVFTVDITLKLFGYGMEFFGDVMNIFDMFVVSISLVEVSIGTGGSNLSALRSIRILRAFRVLRITRLVRSLNYMKIVLSVVSSVITQFVYIFMLLALFIFIYTLLGMQLFGGTFLSESITGIRQNFDTFFSAAFSVFQVLTAQNWNDIETLVLTSSKGQYYVIYLLSWIFIGNWILLNLLQAILLDGFDKDSIVIDEQEDQANLDKKITKKQSELALQNKSEQKQEVDSQLEQNYEQEDASLLIFYPSNWIRIVAIKITTSMIFQNLIIFAIALSSIKLVADTYVSDGSEVKQIFDIIDIVFNGIFIAQATLKIVAQGFILGKNAYLKSSWSKLDFFIVITAIIDMSLGIDLSILKLFRTLRPLRIISRNPDMKIIISSLAESMMGIMNVLVIIMSVFLMFGILGINLYQGKLSFCNPTKELVFNNYGPYNINQSQCQSQGGVWTQQFINFDNILNSMLSMYVFSTRENWPYYVYSFFDGTSDGPVKDGNSVILNMIFSVIIIFICSYFFMDLLVGVLFMNFHEAQAKIRPKTLTDKQINWKNLQKVIVNSDPCFELYLKPQNRFRSFFYRIVTFKWFEIFIALCIIGNILTMIISTDDQSVLKTKILSNINFAFSIIFIVEMILKMLAFSKGYFLSGWNIFDFFVVMASILDIILNLAGVSVTQNASISVLPQIARIFRVLRVTRLLRMFKKFKGLQKLIETFIFSLPALGKGLSIVSLFLFISAVLASYLLGNIKYDYAGSFGQVKNFHNFDNSLELLFIITTGQNWYFYLFESIQQGYVVCKEGTNCTSIYFIVFWLIYVFMSQKVFMQLFVLIVLDQFEANYINQHNPLGIFSLYEQDFRSNWIQFTTKHHAEKIQVKKVVQLLMVLKQPLGLGKNQLMSNYEAELRDNEKNTQEDVKNSLNQLDMKIKKNAAKLVNKMNVIKNRMYMGYHQTFYNFAKISAMSQINQNCTQNQKKQLEEMHKESQQQLDKMKPQGNLFYFDENSDQMAVQALNPIELILFCQMIIKSWHNYSLKYHSESKSKKRQNKKNKPQNNQSLNNSCASDIVEAGFQKLNNEKRFQQRKGLLQSGLNDPTMFQFVNMPNTYEHYKYDKKRVAQFRRLTRRTKKSNIFQGD